MDDGARWPAEAPADGTSQNGEERVLRALLALLPEPIGWCVEFGAWDGRHLSNSYSFIQDDGWHAVLIEGNPRLYRQLLATWSHNDWVYCFKDMVGWGRDDGLDTILVRTPIPPEFDFLSIDIDGNDYHVWAAVDDYRPRIVVIEFNHTVPNRVDFVQAADAAINHGSSIRALVRLGRSRGYELAATTRFNAFFVDVKYADDVGAGVHALDVLRPEEGSVTDIFSGYDGSVFLRGSQSLPWHNLALRESDVQVLPRFLRRYPLNYRRWQLLLYYLYRARDILRRAETRRQGAAGIARKLRGRGLVRVGRNRRSGT